MRLAKAVREEEAAGQRSPAHSGTKDSLNGSSDGEPYHVGWAVSG
jgi:hypothetical protein